LPRLRRGVEVPLGAPAAYNLKALRIVENSLIPTPTSAVDIVA
jgi:hypothetical protein